MDKEINIVVTGAAGFIGSCMVQYLNENGFNNIILVDDFSFDEKKINWNEKKYKEVVERKFFFTWLQNIKHPIACIIHLGARTDTTEFDYKIHEELNLEYTKKVWEFCVQKNVPFIYASSAATYGDGAFGYDDDHKSVEQLKPLNPYGISKNEFDNWALKQTTAPPSWTGLKFFNIYGPNENHKGRMASVIWHSFNQIKQNGQVKLFKSYREGFKDGEQLRDFVYVKDLCKVIFWMIEEMVSGDWETEKNGIYNLGTGKARSFYDLVKNTFDGLGMETNIVFIDMPEDIRDKYQYYTQAKMQKLHDAGYTDDFYSLEAGINEYVRDYLSKGKFY